MKTGFLLIAMAFVLFTGCKKAETTNPQIASAEIPGNALWRAPNGFVVPYSERANWEQISEDALSLTKEYKKYWKTNKCETAEISCGLECIKADRKTADCYNESVCVVCVACGCTPITNPYD